MAKLADLAISPSPPPGGPAGPPTGGLRVGEADPRRLGVHAAISALGVPDEVPPEYVPRYVDAAEFGVRAKVAAAAQRGGFVLLVGGSSVGKTRCAVEAVKALLPEWWLVHPAGPAEVAALAQAPPLRTVVWLDALQRYLDGEHGLTGGVVRALLNASHPAVIIGTLWLDRYTAYTTPPTPGGADPHVREREVLNLASVVRIDSAFSPEEQGRPRAAAARDPRLRIALDTSGYGLTPTLAAAPQLVARPEDARTRDSGLRAAAARPAGAARDQVFISYSHADGRWLKELQIHLEPYVRHTMIAVWDDSMIRAGAVWKESIRQALASAKVAVLLVSPAFLASKFIAEEELPPLLEAAKSEGVAILWVPVRPSSFEVTPIAAYQAAHPPEKPLASLSPAARDKALVKICGVIQQEYLR